MSRTLPSRTRSQRRWLAGAAATAAVLGACALVVRRQAERAERDFPPRGRFVTVDGVRLHFTVHGRDDALQTVVLLHGNGTMGEEFDISGLVRQVAERHRVVVFDRPGYGYSERPAGRRWGPQEQADLLHAAMSRLGIVDPVVLGHSWGALVALAIGLRHPRDVGGLVLASGYYFPSARLDVPVIAAPAVPVLGTLLRHTVSPLLSRLLWPLAVRRVFAPALPTPAFRDRYPVALSMRPGQLRASAQEAAMLIPATAALSRHYRTLDVPVVLIAGAKDRYVSTRWHTSRLHEQVERSWLRIVEGTGHMVHHVATGQVAAAIEQAAGLAWDRSLLGRRPAGLKAGEEPRAAATPPVVPCAGQALA